MTAIRTPDQRLRIFISSTMKELAEARAAARSAIDQLRLTPVLFELGARPYPPRDLYLAYLRQSDVFIGIYGEQYGWIAPDQRVSGLEDEYLNAGEMPKLIYVQSPAPNRDARLSEMLSRIQSHGLSYRGVSSSNELGALIANDLALLLSERFDFASEPPMTAQTRSPLPAPASRFIGREREKSIVRDLLTGGEARLITLLGVGGIGKTRLALEVGAALKEKFDGVVMVTLEGVSTADLLVSAIASALGVPESPGQSLLNLVINYLRPRKMLLIIDNFEHLVAAADLLGELIAQADKLVLLVTSRERLRLSGERVVDVPPMHVPEAVDDDQELLRSDAVALFLDRARAAGSDLDLDHEELGIVAEICRRLDGIPLAIELAASRVKIVGLTELLNRLDRRLSFLTGGPRDLPLRQQTLRSTIAWSHDLLDDPERRLFARLGVFAAGFSLHAAETVCADAAAPAVLDGIASLLDKSLIRTEDPLQGKPRFSMLQVVREFSLEQLDALGEGERFRRAHADYYAGVVVASEPGLRIDPAPVVAQYRADLANIRATVRWSLEAKEGGRVARMAVAMWPFLWIAGLLTEGVEMYQAVLDETTLSTAERADALLGFGTLSFGRGDYERAAPALATAIDLYTELGDVRLLATASVPLGVMRAVQETNSGQDLLTEAAKTFRALDDQWGLAFTLLNLGGALLLDDRYAEALPHLEESVQLARAVKAEVFLSNALINLGLARLGLGDLDSARGLLREAVKHAAAMDNTRESLARALDALAAVAVAADDLEHGATLLGAAEGVRRSIGAVLWVTDRSRHADTETRLRAKLSDSAYTEAIQRGRNLSLTEVLELTGLGDE
jgi:predicted ATPase